MSNGIITRRVINEFNNASECITLLSNTSLQGSSVTVDVSDIVDPKNVKLYFVKGYQKSTVSSIWIITPEGEELGGLSTTQYTQPVGINFTNNIFKLTWSTTGYGIVVSLYALC